MKVIRMKNSLMAVASLGWFLAEGASVTIYSTAPIYADHYSRINTNDSYEVFGVRIDALPDVQQEWHIERCDMQWTISPSKSGRNVPADLKSSSIVVYFDPADFGKSYTIKVKVSWTLVCDTGARSIVDASDSFTLDAIVYDFSVSSADGSVAINGAPLVDNRVAVAIVNPTGCTRPELLDLSFSSNPEEPNPINKAGTAMNFVKQSASIFRAEKVYWYGLAKPNCCYHKEYYYVITLMADGQTVAQSRETVGWPDEHPEANVKVSCPTYSFSLLEGDIPPYSVEMTLGDFVRRPDPIEESTDQYAEETYSEESFHVKQAMGQVGLDKGGEPDLFQRKFVLRELGFAENDQLRFTSFENETMYDFQMRVFAMVRLAIKKEYDDSCLQWELDIGYREKVAKDEADYNAAWTYHCTYELLCGREEDQHARSERQ